MPCPRYGFRFEAVSRLLDLNLSLSVYLRSATFRQNLSFVPIFLHGIVGDVSTYRYLEPFTIVSVKFAIDFLVDPCSLLRQMRKMVLFRLATINVKLLLDTIWTG